MLKVQARTKSSLRREGWTGAVLKNRTQEVSASSVRCVKANEKLVVAQLEFLREHLAEAKGKTEPGLSVVAIF
jgi:hypothetical protein